MQQDTNLHADHAGCHMCQGNTTLPCNGRPRSLRDAYIMQQRASPKGQLPHLAVEGNFVASSNLERQATAAL
jgi:hypothetical protein